MATAFVAAGALLGAGDPAGEGEFAGGVAGAAEFGVGGVAGAALATAAGWLGVVACTSASSSLSGWRRRMLRDGSFRLHSSHSRQSLPTTASQQNIVGYGWNGER